MPVTLTDEQVKALTECLSEAIGGLGVADDGDELVADRLENETPDKVKAWATRWDTVIAFHNANCETRAKYSKPWMLKEVEEQLSEK